jgi:hypothetical protein
MPRDRSLFLQKTFRVMNYSREEYFTTQTGRPAITEFADQQIK